MELDKKEAKALDLFTLGLFYLGIYSEHDNLNLVGIILLGLTIERIAINWLKNRFGCNHFKLQKFAELDMRVKAIRQFWDISNPPYDMNRYR